MRESILLVDDEEGIRKVLGISLADQGFKVHTAGNGEDALRIFKDFSPQIVLTYIKMPDMDGIEIAQRIRQRVLIDDATPRDTDQHRRWLHQRDLRRRPAEGEGSINVHVDARRPVGVGIRRPRPDRHDLIHDRDVVEPVETWPHLQTVGAGDRVGDVAIGGEVGVGDGDHCVALDPGGKAWSTERLAAKLAEWMAAGPDLALLVGGPEGLAQACLEQAEGSWSLSPLTLPHPLVRVVVAEQLYRAWSLLRKHPYHRAG